MRNRNFGFHFLSRWVLGWGALVFATVVGAGFAAFALEKKTVASSGAALQPCLDYGRSFLNTKGGDPSMNTPRFWVESRCLIRDTRSGDSVVYYQTGSCKSEDTFASENLFRTDGSKNYDFLPVFSKRDHLVFRRAARRSVPGAWPEYRTVRNDALSGWGGMVPRLRHFTGRALETPDQVFQAMDAGALMIGQTHLWDDATGREAVIEYPIKTINWRHSDGAWQVDTGPILLPDLGVPLEQAAQKMVLAYIAFNTSQWADFVVEQPLPVGSEEVYHYSGLVHKTTRNVLLALDED